jgi:hypothetical protein
MLSRASSKRLRITLAFPNAVRMMSQTIRMISGVISWLEGLRGIEWVILGLDTAESCAFPRYFASPLASNRA